MGQALLVMLFKAWRGDADLRLQVLKYQTTAYADRHENLARWLRASLRQQYRRHSVDFSHCSQSKLTHSLSYCNPKQQKLGFELDSRE